MRASMPLEVIQIDKPCTADWEAMTGDASERFCSHCQKKVHNLALMPRDAAEKLLCDSAGRLCVRMERAADGAVVTLDYRPASAKRGRWVWPLTALATLAASVGWAIAQNRPTSAVMMGAVPPRSTTLPAATQATDVKLGGLAPAPNRMELGEVCLPTTRPVVMGKVAATMPTTNPD